MVDMAGIVLKTVKRATKGRVWFESEPWYANSYHIISKNDYRVPDTEILAQIELLRQPVYVRDGEYTGMYQPYPNNLGERIRVLCAKLMPAIIKSEEGSGGA